MKQPIPAAAFAAMRAAVEEYQLITPSSQATSAGIASRVAQELIASGFEVRTATRSVKRRRPRPRSRSPRGVCRTCERDYAITRDGRIREHNAPGQSTGCRGSRKTPVPGSITSAVVDRSRSSCST
ncbi:hypothetical protein [Streptomyces sp. NPDC019937]|uniref:hypothetical protein n=1 Tax=Streptomyces sp. NPDC019937 TaxID=3154787 RepID=UPI0033F313F1